MSQFTIVLKALDNLLRSGASLHAEIAPHLNRNGHAPAALINEMARRVEKRYVCEANLTDYGWQFKDADGKRHDAAQRFWQREIRAYDATPKSARGGNTSKQQDAVSKLLAAYEALSAAERRRFKASI
jgi:hypothetical protein